MKLKPPSISREQQAIEDYVGFLLTEPGEDGAQNRAEAYTSSRQEQTAKLESHRLRGASEQSTGSPLTVDTNSAKKSNDTSPETDKNSDEAEEYKAWQALLDDERQQRNKESNAVVEPAEGTIISSQPVKKATSISNEPLASIQADPRLASVSKLLARISQATLLSPLTQVQTQEQDHSQAREVLDEERISATFLPRERQRSRNILPDVFQTLIFKVGKLPLAVPLLKLGAIVKFDELELTRLPGMPHWFMGLLPTDRGNLMVVDSQRFLMPDKKESGNQDRPYEYLIVLDDSQWALACHEVGDAKNLTHEDVRWAARNMSRPWLAGMVIEYMSAMLEVDELINMLAQNVVD